jgi:uncharacterized membrane protein
MVRWDTMRAVIAVAVTVSLAFAAPLVQDAAWVDALPAPLRWYVQPTAGRTNFTLLPYTGFVTAGLAAGIPLTAARGDWAERRFQVALAGLALVGAGAAYWASHQPTIYPPGVSTFWGPSPAFFFLRLAVVAALLPCCWGLRRAMPAGIGALLATLGAASLFVYWVHVELVYGGIAILIKRRVPIELALVAALAGAYGLARLVPIARRWVAARAGRPEPLRRLVARLL